MKELSLKPGTQYTIIHIHPWGASCWRTEYLLVQANEKGHTMLERGKSKQILIKEPSTSKDYLIFEGWGLPLKVDTDTDSFCANACFNFVTDKPEELKEFISKNCLNSTDDHLANILYVSSASVDEYLPLYPALHEEYQ